MSRAPIGVIPAAGRATRLGEPASSKELLPVWRPDTAFPPFPAVHCLLQALSVGGVSDAIVAVRPGKEDIQASLGAEAPGGMRLTYVDVGDTLSPAYTVCRALAGREDRNVVLGFPDILFEALDGIRSLLQELASRSTVDAVLGLFPHPRSRRADVVALGPGSRVRSAHRTGDPEEGGLTWGLAAWRPSFTAFLVQALPDAAAGGGPARLPDLGDVLQAAIDAGLEICGRAVSEAPFLDIGTPDGLAEARRRLGAATDQNR